MSSRTDRIAAEVFRLTGIRITADDPIMAVLLMQEEMFGKAFSGFATAQAETRSDFLDTMAKHGKSINEAADRLERYREQLLVELAQHNDRQLNEAEGRIYAAVSARIVKDVEAANAALAGRLKKLLYAAFAGIFLLPVVVLWTVLSI